MFVRGIYGLGRRLPPRARGCGEIPERLPGALSGVPQVGRTDAGLDPGEICDGFECARFSDDPGLHRPGDSGRESARFESRAWRSAEELREMEERIVAHRPCLF